MNALACNVTTPFTIILTDARPICVQCANDSTALRIAGPLIVNMVVENQAARGLEGQDLYQLSLYIMAGVLAVGFIANFLVRPVSKKHFVEPELVEAKLEADRQAVLDAEAEAKEAGRTGGNAGGVHTAVSMVLALFIGASLAFGLLQTAVKAAGLFM